MDRIILNIKELITVRGMNVYLVGGYLRDKILGRAAGDVDLLVEGRAKNLALELAEKLSGTPVPLDERRDIHRLILQAGEQTVQLDLEGMPEGGLVADLRRRDFTINALSLPLAAYCGGSFLENSVIDPLGGMEDLRKGIIRACSSAAIEDDPLRALRAFRFSAGLGFVLAPDTLQLIRHMRRPITVCAGERIRDELFAILHKASSSTVRLMNGQTTLLEQIFPEIVPLKGLQQGGYHVDDAWEHSLKALERFETLVPGTPAGREGVTKAAKGGRTQLTGKTITAGGEDRDVTVARFGRAFLSGLPDGVRNGLQEYLAQNITRGRSRLPVLKLACLLHDVGKQFCREYAGNGKYTFYGHHRAGEPVARSVAQRLKLSKREGEVLATLVGQHMDLLFLYKSAPVTPRAVRRFFRRAGREAPGLLLLSLADVASSRLASGQVEAAAAYNKFIADMLHKYYNQGHLYVSPPRLLDGAEVCSLLGIKPSPLVRRVLEALADAQAEGVVQTGAEAREFVRRWREGEKKQ